MHSNKNNENNFATIARAQLIFELFLRRIHIETDNTLYCGSFEINVDDCYAININYVFHLNFYHDLEKNTPKESCTIRLLTRIIICL